MSRCWSAALGVIIGFSALTIGAGPLGAEVIGAATGARNQVTGQLGAVLRQISAGTDVSTNEFVRTGPDSAAGLRFLDGSNLNIGEQSEIILDTYVFDPNGPDDVVVNVTKGALRFVSAGTGPHKAVVMTPNALLGIRGTDVISWCADTAQGANAECATFVNTGNVRVCPYDVNSPVDMQQLRRACDAGDTAALPCGYYDLGGTDKKRRKKKDKKEGNFLWWRPGCVVGTPATLPNSAFQALQAQIAAGLPPSLPSQLAALATTTTGGLGGILGGLGGLGALGGAIYYTTQNNGGPVTPQ